MSQSDWASHLHVKPAGFAPMYAQLAEGLREAIRTMAPGDPVPSEKELMEITGVGRVTARKAVGELVAEGLLVAIRGKGTFVASPRVATKLGRLAGFSETMRRLGRVPSSVLISATELGATSVVAERLRVDTGTPLVRIERLRLMDAEPCMLETTHMVAAIVPGLLTHDLTGSLYDLLRRQWGLVPAAGNESIVAMSADRDVARKLTIPTGAAILATSRTTTSDRDIPLEFTLRHARGDLCSFLVPLNSGTVLGDQSDSGGSLLLER